MKAAPTAAAPFDHLLNMSDGHGVFEHALYAQPRPEHGYCTDDMARVLMVAAREPRISAATDHLLRLGLRFLADAQTADGAFRNRRSANGRWIDEAATEDAWGRSVLALGTAAAHAPNDWMRQTAASQFQRSVERRSPWLRATAFAAIGAAEMLTANRDHLEARVLLRDAAEAIPELTDDASWPWPEPRLTYSNAVIPEALIAIGVALDRDDLLAEGLRLLEWLVERETLDAHLSPTPVAGRGPADAGPGFDQQPVEVAALADACARSASADPETALWPKTLRMCATWFLGANDTEAVMWDAATGGSFDGLEADGVNENQGTESTLALLSTMQHARRLVAA